MMNHDGIVIYLTPHQHYSAGYIGTIKQYWQKHQCVDADDPHTASVDTVFTIASYWGRSIIIIIRKLALFDI